MKLNILYIVNKHKMNKKGLCPINCRLTFRKSMKHFATGLFINPKSWNSKQQLIKPPGLYMLKVSIDDRSSTRKLVII